jgi:hypothetical protein
MLPIRRSIGCGLAVAALALLTPVALRAEVKVEKVSCLNLPNCLKLSNGQVEVVVTTDIGPRIIRYAFIGGENILGEIGGKPGSTEWQPWGGHRVWIAPEGQPKSYGVDNSPIKHEMVGTRGIRLMQPVEPGTGIEKELVVTLDETSSGVTVLHRLTNRNKTAFELAPWALTIMNGGGAAIVPQEPYKKHEDALLPARALVLWHYTDLSDKRFAIGPKYIRLKTDAAMSEPQKVGVMNKAGWAAYARQGTVFVKRYPWKEGAAYPDYGCNTEVYTSATFIEVETLGPLTSLAPGAAAEHTERWSLHKGVTVGESEADLDKVIPALVSQVR